MRSRTVRFGRDFSIRIARQRTNGQALGRYVTFFQIDTPKRRQIWCIGKRFDSLREFGQACIQIADEREAASKP